MLLSLFWAPDFYGRDLKQSQLEKLLKTKIPLDEREDEASLTQTKWFDYRFMHPLQATYYLASCYLFTSFDFKRRLAKVRKPWKPSEPWDFLEAPDALDFWRLRRSIDRVGLRYDIFMHFAMMHLLRVGGREERPAPSVAQYLELSRDDACVAWIQASFEKMCGKELQIAQEPIYRVTNFCSEAKVHQEAHEQYVIDQLAKRPDPHVGLHAAIYELGVLREESALEAFGPSIARQAKSLCLNQ